MTRTAYSSTMPRSRLRRWWVGLLAGLIAAGFTPAVRSDVIVLRSGEKIHGKLAPDPKRPDRVSVFLEQGKTPMSVLKVQIQQVIEVAGPLDGYVVRRAAASDSAQSQYDLGLYCDQHKLPDLARFHFESAVKLDAKFGPAHEKLGHVLVGGRWLSGDDLREAQGLVKYRGRWITREEKERHEKETATAAEQTSWARRVRVWREAMALGPDIRRREAEAQLLAIRDPGAVKPLVRTLGTDSDDLRALLARILGAIPGTESAVALANHLVAEEAADVRSRFLDELERRQEPAATKTLVQALRSSAPAVINRAAWALGRLNAVSAVPSLIPALVSTRQRVEMYQPGGMAGEGPAITASFGNVPYMGGPGVPIAFNGSTVAYLTPPAVGPGVVAFGATSAPYYPLPGVPTYTGPMYGGGLGLGPVGGGMIGGSRGPIPQVVTDSFENTEVLAALTKLTGQDFGYNQAAWRSWLRTSFKAEPKPAKSVPQP